MNNADQPSRSSLPCRNMRSKEMYHEAYGQEEDEFSSGIYWCMLTHEPFGPDGQPVGKEECCGKRNCFLG